METYNRFALIFGKVMGIVYLLAGLIVLFSKDLLALPQIQRLAIGLLLVGYGCFRTVNRFWKKKTEDDTQTENSF